MRLAPATALLRLRLILIWRVHVSCPLFLFSLLFRPTIKLIAGYEPWDYELFNLVQSKWVRPALVQPQLFPSSR